ncbi:MAG: MjaI family restriction endonuclease [Candidatus Methanoperedens sp.]|nr:MjaI family restriction endonuclease [Candidatus Methanoperedens sp.]
MDHALWNDLCLNDTWSVGYVSTLIESQSCSEKEDWEAFYYESGNERKSKSKGFPESIVNILNDSLLKYKHETKLDSLSWKLKNINFQYGRTKEEIAEKGKILFEELNKRGNKYGLSLIECVDCVRFRTLCETWNGIIIREHNTINNLKKLLPDIELRKVSGEIDHRYAVDYELLKNNVAICGIQIKPKSYLRDSLFLRKAKEANKRKNDQYGKDYGGDVLYIFSQTNGEIINMQIIKQIKNLLT